MPSLAERWDNDTGEMPDLRRTVFTALCASYAEPHRRYHTLAHLGALFALLDEVRPDIRDWTTVAFAAWYHDIVYDTTRADNEARSAARAGEELARLGLDAHRIAAVEALILATADHAGSAVDADGALFLDADFAILGAPPDRYRRYVQDVRAEYGWVPDVQWRAGRTAFLTKAAAASRTFRTDTFERRFGAQARANMAGELNQLAL